MRAVQNRSLGIINYVTQSSPYADTTQFSPVFMGPGESLTVEKAYEFSLILTAAGLMPDDPGQYWRNPSLWDDKHSAWVAAGSPAPPQSESDEPSEGWSAFCASVVSPE